MESEFWYVLLSEWRSKGHVGLTIPFIIGSQQFLPDSHIEQDIEDLIYGIVDNKDTLIAIKYCFTTEDLVMEIESNVGGLPGLFPTIKGLPQTKLFLKGFSTDLGDNCELVVENLKSRYQDHIDAGRYSKYDRERGDYLPDEKTFIKMAFASYFDTL